jgi:hypothetical protein
MTRAALESRRQAIAAELAEFSARRLAPERRAISDREVALLEEHDAIEYELGLLDFAEREREKSSGT